MDRWRLGEYRCCNNRSSNAFRIAFAGDDGDCGTKGAGAGSVTGDVAALTNEWPDVRGSFVVAAYAAN